MTRPKQSLHNFHFIIDQQLKKRILNLKMFRGNPSFSGTVVKILQLMYPRLEKEHCFGKSRQSQYELIISDTELERCSVHVYLPRDLYRRLKLIHQDLDFYSIAQLIRFMLRLFLDMVKKYGTDFKEKLARCLKSWQQQTKAVSKTNKKKRQLLRILGCNLKQIKLINLYSTIFSPILIFKY